MPHFGEHWDDNEFPLAYLITIRTYGTWLHGDERGSVDTQSRYNVYGAVRRPRDRGLQKRMEENLSGRTVAFNREQRISVEAAIREVCANRTYPLHALSVRSNHSHAVVSALCKPEPVANAFKSYATRVLREAGLISPDSRVWSRGRSRRYLWDDRSVAAAIDYVLYCQGDEEFEEYFRTWGNEKAG